MSKQTAVEWLRTIYENRPAYEECILDEEWEKAKEMERLQHGYTWDSALEYHEKRGYNLMRTIDDFDDYWENKFGGENDN